MSTPNATAQYPECIQRQPDEITERRESLVRRLLAGHGYHLRKYVQVGTKEVAVYRLACDETTKGGAL